MTFFSLPVRNEKKIKGRNPPFIVEQKRFIQRCKTKSRFIALTIFLKEDAIGKSSSTAGVFPFLLWIGFCLENQADSVDSELMVLNENHCQLYRLKGKICNVKYRAFKSCFLKSNVKQTKWIEFWIFNASTPCGGFSLFRRKFPSLLSPGVLHSAGIWF